MLLKHYLYTSIIHKHQLCLAYKTTTITNSRYQLTSCKYKEYALLSLAVACVDTVPSSDLWSKLTELSSLSPGHTVGMTVAATM